MGGVELWTWTVLGVLVTMFAQGANSMSLVVFGALNTVLGVRVFWTHGGPRVTAPGLYALASAMFVGYAAIYLANGADPVTAGLISATIASYWSLLAMWALCWRSYLVHPSSGERNAPGSVTNWLFFLGLALNVSATLLWLGGLRLGETFLREVAFSGMAIVVMAISLHNGAVWRSWWSRLAIAAVGVGFFYQTTFTGYGRLILVALALVPVVTLTATAHRRTIKAALLLAIPPALFLMVRIREQFGEQKYGTELSGIGSVVDPLHVFGRLVSSSGGYDQGYGETFWSTIVVWIPRGLWEEKPVGFGSELTRIFEPQLLSIGQSLAALSAGEWFYNFGWAGLLAMVLVLGAALRLLDRFFVHCSSTPLLATRQALMLVVAVLLVVDVPNLMWGGTFAYVSRTLLRVSVVLVVLLVLPGIDSRKRVEG